MKRQYSKRFNGIKKILMQRYPQQVGIYVVAQSILDNEDFAGGNFAQIMKDYIGSNITINSINNSPQLGKGNLSIQAAMNFLAKAIENERTKENQFLNFIAKKTETNPPSLNEDWRAFVQFFQNQIDLGQLGIQRLQNELNRLKTNSDIKGIDTISKQNEEMTIYHRKRLDTLEYTQKALNDVIDFLSGRRDALIGRTVIDYVYKKKDSLINIIAKENNLDLKFDKQTEMSLILGISQLLIEAFYTLELETNEENVSTQKRYLVQNFEKTISNFLEKDNRARKQINDLITRVYDLPFLTTDLQRLYGLTSVEKLDTNKIITDNILNGEDTNAAINNVFENINFHPNIKLIKKVAGLAEISSSLRQLIAGALHVENTGDINAKPDNVIGWLFIDYQDEKNKTLIKKDVDKALKLIKDEMDNLIKTLKNINTVDYYTQQKQNWDIAVYNIQKILDSLKEKCNANYFIIEDSTKNYLNLYVGEGDNRKMDFKGGSLGANVKDQINKIAALQDGGLISKSDAEWLITAIINAGPNLIGENFKSSLQDYLSAFAVILLFDDQQNIANEIGQQVMSSYSPSQTSVSKIHLFSLDEGYYPLSFVLQLTYDKLSQIYGLIDEETNHLIYSQGNYGAQVEIEGFIDPDQIYPPEKRNSIQLQDWNKLSQMAQTNVKFHVKFLTNFLGLLNAILKE